MPFINSRRSDEHAYRSYKLKTVKPSVLYKAEMQYTDNPLIHINRRQRQR